MAAATLLVSSFTFGKQQHRRKGVQGRRAEGCFAGEALAERGCCLQVHGVSVLRCH